MAGSGLGARKNRRRRPRIFWRTLVVALFAVLAVGFVASPAQAHATLEGTDPSPSSIVDVAPTAVTLTFSEPVQPVADRVKVIAPNGSNVRKGAPTATNGGARLRILLASHLGQGTYLVSYRIISADGHPVSGSLTFSIGAPSALGASKVAADAGTTVDGVVRIIQSAGRYAAYCGIALLAGPLVILLGLWPRRLNSGGPRRLAWVGWAVLMLGTLDVLVLQQPYAEGNAITAVRLSGVGDTIDSTVGRALLARMGLLVAAIPVLLRVLRSADPDREEPAWAARTDRVLAALFGVAVLVTFPFAGHGAQSPAPLASVPVIALHVGAMAIWLGGLIVLARYLLPRARYRELEVIMPVWSRWAFWSVAGLVFSGAIETLLELGGFGHLDYLLTTTYGQLVVTKVIWLGAIMVVAANARTWVRRRFGTPVAYALAADARSDDPGKASKNAPARKASVATTAPRPPAPKGKPVPKGEPADFSGAGKVAEEVRRLRTRVAIEVLLAAVVLALATALVQVAPARDAGAAAAAAQNLPYSSVITMSKNVLLQVDLSPTRTGANELHLTAYDAKGFPVKVAEWRASADLASQKLTSQVSVLPLTNNHAVGQVDLPYPGAWKFTFTVRTSDIDEATVVRTVTVR